MGIGSRVDQWLVTANVAGRDLGMWNAAAGGAADSEELVVRGPTGQRKSYGGPQSVENLTLTRTYEGERDNELEAWLIARRGKARVTAARQPKDADGNVFGRPITYIGTLKSVQAIEPNSNEAGEVMLGFEMTVEETA